MLLLLLMGCADDAASIGPGSGGTGQGGSLARFTIIGDYLYALETNQLNWFRLEANGQMESMGQLLLNEGKETIFPLGDLLFVGATDGMSIFQVDSTGQPVLRSEIQHFLACDPVVSDGEYAYVTLRTEGCGGFFRPNETENVLNVYVVADIDNPQWLASYPMRAPRGLGLAGDYLFVCEGQYGLRTLDVRDPTQAEFIALDPDVHANDVIVLPDVLIVIGPDKLTQFDYSDPTNLRKLSEISI
ncbi:MAG: hypothetical protein D6772_05220 [Bacteroidetes bacterium]|nr:MAG: hypothetical protein D6772_05220 [Bacteroidota bacterium]